MPIPSARLVKTSGQARLLYSQFLMVDPEGVDYKNKIFQKAFNKNFNTEK